MSVKKARRVVCKKTQKEVEGKPRLSLMAVIKELENPVISTPKLKPTKKNPYVVQDEKGSFYL